MKKSYKKIKIMTVISTRPDIIKLSEIIKEFDREADHVLVHTGQNYDYELNEIFYKDLKLRKPDHFLNAAGETPIETISNILVKTDKLLEEVKPHAFFVLGDVNGQLSVYAAKRKKVPIFHMEAGNRSFDERLPEEVNRRIIDHTSDINMVYSDLARQNLLNEGIPLRRIIKIGSPMFEVINKNKSQIKKSDIIKILSIKSRDYFVLSIHRDENISNDNFLEIVEIIKRIAKEYEKKIIFSTHPRTQRRIDEMKIRFPKNVISLKPLGFTDYIKLQENAFCTLTDSGTISEESAILNFPAVNLRESHERNEAMDETSVIMSGLNPDRVIQAIDLAVKQKRKKEREFFLPDGYSSDNVSKKVLRVILSYTDYINRTVWFKK